MCKVARLLIGQFVFTFVGHLINVGFDWLWLVIWPKQSAMQFSTELSSSGGIICKKTRLVFVKIDWKIILGI